MFKSVLWSALTCALSWNAFATPGKIDFHLEEERCATLGDSLSQEPAELAGRYAWARMCLPQFELYFDMGQNSKNENRAIYPTFGRWTETGAPSNPENWKAPTAAPASKADCNVPSGYTLVGFCTAGCFTPDVVVDYGDKQIPIGDGYAEKRMEVISLTEDSTLGKLSTKRTALKKHTRDIVDGNQDVLDLSLASGGKLTVTPNHPLLDAKGVMRDAQSLKVGESLLRADGTPDAIERIAMRNHFGRVYNVDVASDRELENVVIANGYLSGSIAYQNEWQTKLNRRLLRDILPLAQIQ